MLDIGSMLQPAADGIVYALRYWWVWTPIALGVGAYASWVDFQRAAYIAGMKWTVLEIVPPPEIPFSSPLAAEHFFAGLHATYAGAISWKARFFQGKIADWASFEVASNGGETHLYIRCPEGQRNIIESLIFSQYPTAEIKVIPDYVGDLPEKPDLGEYDIAGMELEFTKDQAYPIRTYHAFEDAGGKDEYARLDPIAPLMEVMSALRPGERLWVQYVIQPTGDEWTKEQQKALDKLLGKAEKPKPLPFAWLLGPIDRALGLVKVEEKKEEKPFSSGSLTPAQKDLLEQVEHKLNSLAFQVGIRLIYVARKESFNGSRIASVIAMYKQLYANNLNAFKPADGTKDKGVLPWMFPSDKGFFADERTAGKKHRMFSAFRNRSFPSKQVFLTVEELATLWHLPGLNVQAPLLPRVQAKKGQPPTVLPTR